jgi:hypothetical protein
MAHAWNEYRSPDLPLKLTVLLGWCGDVGSVFDKTVLSCN